MKRDQAPGGIEWQGVSKRYGQQMVIENFNLSIGAGEFIALLGPSGCGKSTLLRMVAGLEPVSAGRIAIGGRDVTALEPGQRGIAMVFQQYALYPHMTVRENMAFGLRNIGMDKAQIAARVEGAAHMLELESLLERKPVQLSGGQRQRVAIGRAVVKEPQAFLFDEPLSNLDAALRTRTRLELARLHKRLGATMLFVTHDQVEAMTLANRIAVLNQGRVEQFAAPMELYLRPATRFVAGFVGSPAMNFLPVRRAADQEGLCAVTLSNGATVRTAIAATAIAAPATPANGPLELGLRADALVPAPDGQLRGVVEVIERLGERTLLHVQLADGLLVVADAPRHDEPALGSAIALRMDMRRAHLFDAAGAAHHPS
ncbi:MAG: sn-glycerol-3-phosphate ABC transporter ATP-binding protein UgpC [Pseudomonadota bacterium]